VMLTFLVGAFVVLQDIVNLFLYLLRLLQEIQGNN
jgi:FtsH-binding integral membrane protein